MYQNTFCNPRLYIEGIGVIESIQGKVDFPNHSKISSINITIPGNKLPESALINKKIKFYLNHGSDDTVPYFIGYIKDLNVSSSNTKIKAYDPRCFLGGESAEKLIISDSDNYDGYTISQFLNKYIKDEINKDKVHIDYCGNDTNPPVTMSGYRNENTTPYSAVLELMSFAVDDSDIFNMFGYSLGVKFGIENASVFFIKERPLDDSSFSFSYGDGIIDYSYKKNKIPNRSKIGNITTDFGGNTHNQVRTSKDVAKYLSTKRFRNAPSEPALVRKEMLKALVKARGEKYDITINASKGYYIDLGAVVNINVDEEFRGNHRLTSKQVSFGKSGTKLVLKFETKANINSFY